MIHYNRSSIQLAYLCHRKVVEPKARSLSKIIPYVEQDCAVLL